MDDDDDYDYEDEDNENIPQSHCKVTNQSRQIFALTDGLTTNLLLTSNDASSFVYSKYLGAKNAPPGTSRS